MRDQRRPGPATRSSVRGLDACVATTNNNYVEAFQIAHRRSDICKFRCLLEWLDRQSPSGSDRYPALFPKAFASMRRGQVGLHRANEVARSKPKALFSGHSRLDFTR
ncbi:hypothetical protein M4J40_18940 [Pleomorphomonas sp. NRK JP5]|nr:hypothetical protein [Pleomorphomonas sp. JP5]